MTVAELYRKLLAEHGDNPDAEVRIVYHGFEKPSFNLPASSVSGGGINPLNIVCEEPRVEGARRDVEAGP